MGWGWGWEFVDLQAMLSGSGSEAYAIQIGQTEGAPSLQLVSWVGHGSMGGNTPRAVHESSPGVP